MNSPTMSDTRFSKSNISNAVVEATSPELLLDAGPIRELIFEKEDEFGLKNHHVLDISNPSADIDLATVSALDPRECDASMIESASFLISCDSSTKPLHTPTLDKTLVTGPPGKTPYPHRAVGVSSVTELPEAVGRCISTPCDSSVSYDVGDSAISSVSTKSIPPPLVPFNSPEDDQDLVEALKSEAKKQETEIKDQLQGRNLMELLKKPPNFLPPSSRPRKRRHRPSNLNLDNEVSSVEDLERMAKDQKITEYRSPMSIHEKEVVRRRRINAAIVKLRKLVPGITEDTENTDVYETAAKYIIFLKGKVGAHYDKDFLLDLMPF